MTLKEKIPTLLKYIEAHKDYLTFHKQIFDISEGALLSYVEGVVYNQIKRKESAKKMCERIPSINILNKIVSKLSSLYSDDVKRISNAEDLVAHYSSMLNEDLQEANKNLNRYKNTTVEIYEDNGTLQTRAIPSWQCLPYSDDAIDSTRMTVMIKLMGKRGNRQIYWAYSDNEFISFDEKGELETSDMVDNEGINPFGVIPFVYRGVSKNMLLPIPDKDLYQMTVLVPLLMAEVNFGAQYLSMPLIWSMDLVIPEDFSRNPDTFLSLYSDPKSDKQGTMGVLQPNMDIDAQIKLVKEQLDIWLTTRDIRAGTIGGTFDSDASGISLMIKNMDASKNIKSQARLFKNFEDDLWYKLSVMHNLLIDAGRNEVKEKFPEDLMVEVIFKDTDIIEPRADKVNTQKAEVDAGLKSKQTAIQELNPDWTPERVQEEIILINNEQGLRFGV